MHVLVAVVAEVVVLGPVGECACAIGVCSGCVCVGCVYAAFVGHLGGRVPCVLVVLFWISDWSPDWGLVALVVSSSA